MLLTFSGNIEAVDNGERRTIAGKIAPYGEVGNTSAGRVVFAENSIKIPEPSKVKLLMQHDNSKPVGRMQTVTSNKSGLYGSFKVSASTRGSDAILLAQEKLMDGLSVGVEVEDSRQEKDYLLVLSATLKEVSLVESAAFPSAAVMKIAANENAVDENQPKETKGETVDKAPDEVAAEGTYLPDGATVTLKSVSYKDDEAEGATQPVEAARRIIKPSALNSQRVRTPIVNMGAYTEHKIKAALGDETSRLYVTAADDDFSTNPAFNPTQYLTEFVTNTRFGTPAIDACSQGTLPASGMTISVPSLVTSAGGQAGVAPVVTVEAEGGAVQNTGMVTQYLSGTVSKYSGMNTLSVELLSRSEPNFYAELTQQLQNAYLKTIDTAVLTALLAAGMNGTSTTADLDGIVDFAAEGAQTIYTNTGYFATNYLANPAQWGALISAQDTTKRPVFTALQPMNAAGQVAPTSIRGSVLGLDLYVDKNFTATTFDDDSAIILAPEAFTVYRSPQAYMSVNVVSNLQVQVAIYGFMATIAKMPNGIIKYKKT
jgi:HK97 family phage prohead protease